MVLPPPEDQTPDDLVKSARFGEKLRVKEVESVDKARRIF